MRIIKNIFSFIGMFFVSLILICVCFPKIISSYFADNASISEDEFIISWTVPNTLRDVSVLSKTDSLLATLKALRRASADERVKGMLLKLDECELSFSSLYEISRCLSEFKKPIYAYGANISNSAYLLACNAGVVYMHPDGVLNLTGVCIAAPFMRTFLDNIGVSFQIEKREEYKSFADMYSEKDMSAAQKNALTEILKNYNSMFVDCLAKRKQSADALINNGPYSARRALSEKLVDKILSHKEAMNDILQDKLKFVEFEKYVREKTSEESAKKLIGVICLEGGIIVDKKSPYDRESVITREGVERIIKSIKDSKKKYDAYIIRINSRGGSAVASEDVLRELKDFVKEAKVPVLVSMGNYAASGGYWIACGLGCEIFATPYTLTGSIGVIGMLPNIQELMKKVGVNYAKVGIGKNSSFGSPMFGMSADEKAKFAGLIDEMYDNFLKHVASSRKMTVEEVRKLAKGRVWSGQAAYDNKLIDHLGSFYDAVAALKKKIAKDEEDVDVVIIFEKIPLATRLIYKLQDAGGVMSSLLIREAVQQVTSFLDESKCKVQMTM